MISTTSSQEFSLQGSRYDLSKFMGRFQYFLEMTDPRILLQSTSSIQVAQEYLSRYKSSGVLPDTPDKMWSYRRLVEGSVHPVTNDLIPMPCRMAAIAPVNIPLIWAMMNTPASNVGLTLFLHFANQSYNTACNYFNRSGASMSNADIATAYGLAVSSACAFAFGLGKVVEHGPPVLRSLGILVPVLATSAANVSNIGLTRISEITNGVPVLDAEGNAVGTSKIAGTVGVFQSAITRCVLVPCACLLLPNIFMTTLKKLKYLPRSRTGALLVELGIVYASLQVMLPVSLAVFPQEVQFNASSLEPHLQNLRDKHGVPITTLYANKGL